MAEAPAVEASAVEASAEGAVFPGEGLRGGLVVAGVLLGACLIGAAPRLIVPSSIHDFAVPAIRIDLNRADAETIALLPDVGPSLASAIVAERLRAGAFGSIDELTRVQGIGEAVVRRLQPHVRVGGSAAGSRTP